MHRLAALPAVTIADLDGETWILRAAGSASGQVVERALQARHALQGHILRLQGSAAVKQAVMAGLGIAMVSRSAITREVQHGFLRALPVLDLQVEREITLIWRQGVRLPATAVAFLDLLLCSTSPPTRGSNPDTRTAPAQIPSPWDSGPAG